MTIPTAVPDTTIAQSHRVIGMVNLALAFVCVATPAIRSYAGAGAALLLAMGLLTGAGLMFLVAHCFDPRPHRALTISSDASWRLGARRLATA